VSEQSNTVTIGVCMECSRSTIGTCWRHGSLPAAPPIPVVGEGVARNWPLVRGRCPACRLSSLFLGAGGYVTCSSLTCPDPGAASDMLTEEPNP
jgi:hypothetical protein